jgi:uncharacterized membrane protein
MSAPRTHAKPVRIVRAHYKLVTAAAFGIVLYCLLFLLRDHLELGTRLLIAWDAAVFLYLVMAVLVIARFELSRARQRAEAQDEGALLILILTAAAAAASLAAIFMELSTHGGRNISAPHIALALSTIILSWLFIHVIFAFHYAHEFYGDQQGGHKGGLRFPEDERPDYWDFIYFSFAIGMASEVSDVQVTSKPVRRLVLAHGALSFLYNVAVIALMVNITAALIG